MAFEIKRNDRRPYWRVQLTANNLPVDISGAQGAYFTMRQGQVIKVNDAPMDLITPATGVVEYKWLAGDTDTGGNFEVEVRVDWGAGEDQTFPSVGHFDVIIRAEPLRADLITLDRLLDALNKLPGDMESQEIEKYESAIAAASAAVRAYADRDFTVSPPGATPTLRTFEYDDSGYVDIDDAQSVTGVTINFPNGGWPVTLTPTQFQASPFNGPVYDSLILYSPTFYAGSKEMGFTWNLDRYEGPVGPPPTLDVTANWGWPEIPEDVQQATVWAAAAFAEDARQITSESIEGFSRSMNVLAPTALPLRSRDLLDQYRRVVV